MSAPVVVTHGYTDGTTISVCAKHDRDVPNYSEIGASYAGVSHGAHEGECDLCGDPDEVAS